MARRGRCRCGLILKFHRTAQGYKMRCPSCGAVVRLRVNGKKRRGPPPQPTVLQRSSGEAAPAPDEIDVELVSPSELAAAVASPPRRRKGWLLVAGGAALMAAVGGLVWWFCR